MMKNTGGYRGVIRTAIVYLLASLVVTALRPAAQAEEVQDAEKKSGARAPSLMVFGWEGGNYFSYPYMAFRIPLWGNLDNGWHLKLWGDGLQYQFNVGQKRIEATGPAGEALVGSTITRRMGSLRLMAGPQYRHTSYDQGFQSNQGFNDLGLKTEFTGTGHLSDILNLGDMVHSNVTAFYTSTNEMYRLQGRPLLIGARDGIEVGPEAIYLENPNFQRQCYGLAVTNIPLIRKLSLTAHAGYMHHESKASGALTTGAYFGVAFSVPFGGGPPAPPGE